MSKRKKIIIGVAGGIVAFTIILFVVVFSVLNGQMNAEFYELGSDKISSVKVVVGERGMTGVSTAIENGISKKSYNYKSETSAEDIKLYITHLLDNEGFLPLDMNNSGDLMYAKVSADEGKIIVIDVMDTGFGFTLTIQKGSGTLSK